VIKFPGAEGLKDISYSGASGEQMCQMSLGVLAALRLRVIVSLDIPSSFV